MEEEEDSELYGHKTEISSSTLHSYIQDRLVTVYAFFFPPRNLQKKLGRMNET